MTLPADFLREAKRWIAFDTVTTRPNGAFAAHLARRFRALGFRVRLRPVRSGGRLFHNVLARRGPAGRPLLLNTHLDTVPAGPPERWTATGGRPWRAALRGARLYGLGAADVKLNLLCQWQALRELGARRFRRPLCVAGTFGEESGLLGAKALAAGWKGPRPRLALVGEPSEGRLIDRHRGYLVFEWYLPRGRKASAPLYARAFAGRSAHSSTPNLGANAVERALDALEAAARRGLRPSVHSLSGGTAANQVPASCRVAATFAGRPPAGFRRVRSAGGAVPWRLLRAGLRRAARVLPAGCSHNLGRVEDGGPLLRVTFDVRFPASAPAARLIASVKNALRRACREEGVPFWLVVERNNPGLTAAPSAAFRVVREALRRSGLPAKAEGKLTCTEAGVYRRWGVPAAVWGPGRSAGNIHRPNESISLSELSVGVKFYRRLLEAWCRPVS